MVDEIKRRSLTKDEEDFIYNRSILVSPDYRGTLQKCHIIPFSAKKKGLIPPDIDTEHKFNFICTDPNHHWEFDNSPIEVQREILLTHYSLYPDAEDWVMSQGFTIDYILALKNKYFYSASNVPNFIRKNVHVLIDKDGNGFKQRSQTPSQLWLEFKDSIISNYPDKIRCDIIPFGQKFYNVSRDMHGSDMNNIEGDEKVRINNNFMTILKEIVNSNVNVSIKLIDKRTGKEYIISKED
jgi:hypothetical protein